MRSSPGLAAGEPIGLVQIDAHADTARGTFQGNRLNDCSVFLNAVLDEAIDPERTIQIGMRGSLSPYWDFSREAGMRLIPMHEAYELGVKGLLEEIRRVIGDGPFYFTLDTDGLDATFLPGTELARALRLHQPRGGADHPRHARHGHRGCGSRRTLPAL